MVESESSVPNPRRADLQKLRNDLAKEVESLGRTLKRPAEDIGGDKVWVGKNARAWHREVAGRHRKLGEQVGGLLPIVDAAIRDEPEKVSAAQARSYQRSV
ncbi:hypothetical protein ACFVZC_17755 [Streptomyces marokkonensis]|uniref:WXG100 family type VII secretion target n=1 Tax=Streptomyces marokkonensis TaxID=324855 RepID=A0ABW6Q7R1_9ACTN|nr:hypothetical protein [Streptomyces marokkonensis]